MTNNRITFKGSEYFVEWGTTDRDGNLLNAFIRRIDKPKETNKELIYELHELGNYPELPYSWYEKLMEIIDKKIAEALKK